MLRGDSCLSKLPQQQPHSFLLNRGLNIREVRDAASGQPLKYTGYQNTAGIEQTPEGLVLRLKHFNPGLIGWEEKAQVHSYPLIEYQQGIATFERDDKKSRLTFRRTSKDTLSVLLEQTTDGKRNSQEFKFKLVK